jgi:hypothetical protein
MHHSAFEYERFSDLMSSYARMRDEGIVPAFSLDHGITMSLHYKDPEGNFVELQSDNFGDWKRSTEWIERLPISDPIPSGRFSIQRRCIKRIRAASRSRNYSPPYALEILTGLDPQHWPANFRQHAALRSPMSGTLTETLNASAW